MAKFKDSMNRWYTKGLFYETSGYQIENAIFTLSEEDKEVKGKKLLSFKRLFVSSGDPTEYEFARDHLGGWAHWKAVQGVKDLESFIEDCREELEVKLRSEGIRKIGKLAEDEKGYQAAKYMADKGWSQRKAGAPSKSEKAGQRRVDRKLATVLTTDFERIKGLNK